MEKQSVRMVRQILSSFTHMSEIDSESEALILGEIERVKSGSKPKKKEGVEDAKSEKKSS